MKGKRDGCALALWLVTLAAAVAAPPPKGTVPASAYGQWEMLRGSSISNDGHWLAYSLAKVDGDSVLVVRDVDSTLSVAVPNGSGAAFTEDSKWVAYGIGYSRKEAQAARDPKKPLEMRLGLKDLVSGEEKVFNSVQAWRFTKNGRYLLALHYRPSVRSDGGCDLLVIDLQTKRTLTIGNVSRFSPNEDGTLVALGIDSDGKEQGVQLLDPTNFSLRTLYWGSDSVGGLSWAKKSDAVAFMIGREDPKKEGRWNIINLITGVSKSDAKVLAIDPSGLEGFPKGSRIVEDAPIELADDGASLLFSIRKWDDKKKPAPGDPQDKPDVDVWHSRDVDPQPLQQRRAGFERVRSFSCIWRGGKVLQIEDEKIKDAVVLKGNRNALGSDDSPYRTAVNVGGLSFADWYSIDLVSGKRTKLVAKSQWPLMPSFEGKYAAYYRGKDWWIIDLTTNGQVNLTSKLGAHFEDVDYDGPQKAPPFEAPPVWLADDKGVVMADKYDCWLVDPATGAAKKMTEGRKAKIESRVVDVANDEKPPSLENPIYFHLMDEDTKAAGFALRQPDGTVKQLFMDAVMVGGLVKAKHADRMIFTLQSYEKSPNVYLTNGVFKEAKPLTKTNPQQERYLWGKAELVKYRSSWGKDLAGALIYPANYQSGRLYPMVTLIYERESSGLNAYRPPIDRDSYNVQILSQNGYFVLLPDIAYRTRQPGVSAVDCLEHAVAAVLARHVGVDAQRIGLMGHSWGAYETAYTVTVSKVFAAGVAGAPLTDMVEMYNSFYWNAGITNQVIFESSQGRFDVPWWQDLRAYMENSPVFQAQKMNKPLMIAFGDKDGAVDWHQGQYLYNTLRRMGKFIIMLVYPGENHGLAKRGNQLDYAHRLRHFFDVYLKGAKPEPWITEGVPFLKKDGE